MREHMGLFRGKRLDSGEWVEGYLSKRPSAIQIGAYCPWYISVPPLDPDDNGGYYNVDPDTVGECTGLKDTNGKLIFEGDILEGYDFDADSGYGEVELYDGAFEVANNDWVGTFHENYKSFLFEIIGNIHDNPELLESEG